MFRKRDNSNGQAAPDVLSQAGSQGEPINRADNIVEIEDVHKSFVMGKEAVPALRGVTLQVRRGEVLCLMGPSGSGKTTLLNILGGLDTPSRGHVIVDGQTTLDLDLSPAGATLIRWR